MKGNAAMRYGICAEMTDYRLLKELGYDYIELRGAYVAGLTDEETEKLAETIKSGGLECIGFNALVPANVAFCGESFDENIARDYAGMIAKRLSQLGGKALGLGSPNSRKLPSGYDRGLALEQGKQFVRIFCEAAKKYGLAANWETLNNVDCQFGTVLSDDIRMVRELRAEGIDNLGMVCDLYQLMVNDTPESAYEEGAELFTHLHIAQPPYEFRGYPTKDMIPAYRRLLEPVLKAGHASSISIETSGAHTVAENGRAGLQVLRELIEG